MLNPNHYFKFVDHNQSIYIGHCIDTVHVLELCRNGDKQMMGMKGGIRNGLIKSNNLLYSVNNVCTSRP